MSGSEAAAAVSIERIADAILVVRGYRVLLDAELAELYAVSTKALLQAVKRNRDRFPDDFMISITAEEWKSLRSQIVISNARRGGRRHLPYAFTEQGVAMLSSVLRSSRAITVNIQIMRAFVRMRQLLNSNVELARRLNELESRLEAKLATHDDSIAAILSAIRQLMRPPESRSRAIGFTADL
jgi:hypothetical protein